MNSHLLSIAPMMKYTDRHFRYLMRLITKKTRLYTEMLTTSALLKAKNASERFLAFHPMEHPLAIQLGGCVPKDLALCAKMAEDLGYDEVNLNIGCPSSAVQNARFGACLFAEPQLVAECVAAIRNEVKIPVTVKTRIGIDSIDAQEDLHYFVQCVSEAGCEVFIIHARKAWLKGLSPKQNRSVPPLRYEVVYQLKQCFPQLKIILNGGIVDLKNLHEFYRRVDGLMIGRAAYQKPYDFISIDRDYFSFPNATLSRAEIGEQYQGYMREELKKGTSFSILARPLLALSKGLPNARQLRTNLLREKISS